MNNVDRLPFKLHPDDMRHFVTLSRLGSEIARAFDLPQPKVEHKRRPAPMSSLGLCYFKKRPPRISIVIRYRNYEYDGGEWWSKRLPGEEILETLCHEMAHLRYHNHGSSFKLLRDSIILYVKGKAVDIKDKAEGREVTA